MFCPFIGRFSIPPTLDVSVFGAALSKSLSYHVVVNFIRFIVILLIGFSILVTIHITLLLLLFSFFSPSCPFIGRLSIPPPLYVRLLLFTLFSPFSPFIGGLSIPPPLCVRLLLLFTLFSPFSPFIGGLSMPPSLYVRFSLLLHQFFLLSVISTHLFTEGLLILPLLYYASVCLFCFISFLFIHWWTVVPLTPIETSALVVCFIGIRILVTEYFWDDLFSVSFMSDFCRLIF